MAEHFFNFEEEENFHIQSKSNKKNDIPPDSVGAGSKVQQTGDKKIIMLNISVIISLDLH